MQPAVELGRNDAEARVIGDAELCGDGAGGAGRRGGDEGRGQLPALQYRFLLVVGRDGRHVQGRGRRRASCHPRESRARETGECTGGGEDGAHADGRKGEEEEEAGGQGEGVELSSREVCTQKSKHRRE